MAAGGNDWYYVSHADLSDVWQDGAGQWWTRKHLCYTIERQEHALNFDPQDTEVGTYSGILTYMIGDQPHSYLMSSAYQFLCTGDSGRKIEVAVKYVLREQRWEWWGRKEKMVNPPPVDEE